MVSHLAYHLQACLSDSCFHISSIFIFVDDIGANIEGAQASTTQGTTHLVKAAKTQRSNSSLVIYDAPLFSFVLVLGVGGY